MQPTPLFIFDLLGRLDLGQQLTAAAILLIVAFYLFRGVRMGKTVGAVLGSGVAYLLAVLVASAVAIGLGWLQPDLGTITGHIQTVTGFVSDVAADWLGGLINGVVP